MHKRKGQNEQLFSNRENQSDEKHIFLESYLKVIKLKYQNLNPQNPRPKNHC